MYIQLQLLSPLFPSFILGITSNATNVQSSITASFKEEKYYTILTHKKRENGKKLIFYLYYLKI